MKAVLLFTIFMVMISCRPEQQATVFNSTRTPENAKDKQIETQENIAIHVVFTKDPEEGAIDLRLLIAKEPSNGKLRDCTFEDLKVDCIYHPNTNFYGNDEVKFQVKDGDFSSPELATLKIIVHENPGNRIVIPDPDPDPPGNNDPGPVKKIVDDCEKAMANGTLRTFNTTVNFPAAIECAFNENGMNANELNAQGNGPRKNGKVRARVEQYVNLVLPNPGKICDIDFNFPTQTMQYDDEIFLLLNGFVLTSSTNYSVQSGSSYYQTNGLYVDPQGIMKYNWYGGNNRLYDLYYSHNVTPRYCLGVPNNDPNFAQKCQIPRTETNGQIKLDIPSRDIIRLGFASNNLSNLSNIQFGFVSTGDNDNGDCEHSAFGFNVSIKYIQ